MLLMISKWVIAFAAAALTQYMDASTTARNVNAPCHCMTEVNPYFRPGNNATLAFGKHLAIDGAVLFATRRWSDSNKTILWTGFTANAVAQISHTNGVWNGAEKFRNIDCVPIKVPPGIYCH